MIQVKRDGSVFNIDYLDHMVLWPNLSTILTSGILSHNEAYSRKVIKDDISLKDVQLRRARKIITNINKDNEDYKSILKSYDSLNFSYVNHKTPFNKIFARQTHEFASLYFNSRNPMLYRLKSIQNFILILQVDSSVLNHDSNVNRFSVYSDGNIASEGTKLYSGIDFLDSLDFSQIFCPSWFDSLDELATKENKRIMCSEVLVYPFLEVKDIKRIVCNNRDTLELIQLTLKSIGTSVSHIEAILDKNFYF